MVVGYNTAYIRQHVPYLVWAEWISITVKQPSQTDADVQRAIDAFRAKHGEEILRHIYKARM